MEPRQRQEQLSLNFASFDLHVQGTTRRGTHCMGLVLCPNTSSKHPEDRGKCDADVKFILDCFCRHFSSPIHATLADLLPTSANALIVQLPLCFQGLLSVQHSAEY